MLLKLIILFFSLMFLSCEVTQELKPEIYYQRDLEITENGTVYNGVGILPEKSKYEITVKQKEEINLVIISTCHRVMKDYPNDDSYKFIFTPIALEKDNCGIDIDTYNKNGHHRFGHLELYSKGFGLSAKLACNGLEKEWIGFSICQRKEGLIQEITFKENMVLSTKARCALPMTTDNKTFRILDSSIGQCTYIFKSQLGIEHKLKVITYDGILIDP